MKTHPVTQAFTLIELLVVFALLAVVAVAGGIALRSGPTSAMLRSGQSLVASMLAAGRGYAALHATRVVLLVDAEPTSEGFLRRLQLAAEGAPDSELWQPLDLGILLPSGVFVVPDTASVKGVSLQSDRAPWPTAWVSTLVLAEPESLVADDAGPHAWLRLKIPLGPTDTPAVGSDDRVVLASGRRTLAGVELRFPLSARGVVLSDYGLAVPVDGNASLGF